MLTLITGKSGSGKSLLAEDLAVKTGCEKKYYIATMKPADNDAIERIRKHRMQREGKGFVTYEIETGIDQVEVDMPEESAVLLECIPNLVGNEMHDSPVMSELCHRDRKGEEEFAEMLARQVVSLSNKVKHLLAVTSSYAKDENDDEDTAMYKRLLDAVNAKLEAAADELINKE
ncbi:MAG: bifunctional adenosylcobinamide kinase/adenosylcobinamide-phosphate guanylyltransferase [Lachnospiraceae bacterium]|nr:bifunctional adenosylcobinamide kinase/adenosylcobinamide-phosphate guanylyltransferase [Lachnospiraceae bacterium]